MTTIQRPRRLGSLYSISTWEASKWVGAVPARLVPGHESRHLTAAQSGIVHVGVNAGDRIAEDAVGRTSDGTRHACEPEGREPKDVDVLVARAGRGDRDADR